jgi:single-stranded-DNA-specific exonuclease
VVGGRHLKLRLNRAGQVFDAILFGTTDTLPPEIEAVYRLEVNEYNGARGLQLTLHHWHPAPSATPVRV